MHIQPDYSIRKGVVVDTEAVEEIEMDNDQRKS